MNFVWGHFYPFWKKMLLIKKFIFKRQQKPANIQLNWVEFLFSQLLFFDDKTIVFMRTYHQSRCSSSMYNSDVQFMEECFDFYHHHIVENEKKKVSLKVIWDNRLCVLDSRINVRVSIITEKKNSSKSMFKFKLMFPSSCNNNRKYTK
jgi:hypothetical protein